MMANESEAVGVGQQTGEKSSETEDERILRESREGLQSCIEAESDEREKMLDDLRFATLDQWPAEIRAQRENDVVNGPRPCLTVDQVNQYITQVANDMRANRPSIKTRPVDDVADPETAKIFQGLVRHIEDQSNAQVAYQTAGDSQVTVGLGFFRITTDYVDPDSFDQEIQIKRVPDTFSVYLGQHIMPDGSDAEKGWIFEQIPKAKFERDYPKASVDDQDFVGLGVMPTWKTADTVTVCEYFYKEYTPRKLLYLGTGMVMSREDYDKMPKADRPAITGERTTHDVTVKWCKHSGCEVLDKRTLKGKYIPIVEVVGKEKIVDGKRRLWGLVRPAKDSLRAFNYWISAMTEKMALAPKAPFIGAVGQFATQGDRWDKANVNNYAKLEYDAIDVNGNAVPPPRRQEPVQMEVAMAQLLSIMQNNVKSSLGMYKASVGDTDSQQSGRAILALKRESDTGTMHFGENQALSIQHAGRIIVDLIPHYYDQKRIIRILGEDGKADLATIDPEQKMPRREYRDDNGKLRRVYNLGVGKYDVTVTVGPGYTTSRQEASTVMTELANSAKDPVSAAIMRYGAVKNADFHGSDEITRMLEAVLPPNVRPQPAGDEQIPPQAMAKIAELTQGLQMMQQQGQELMQENQQLKAGTQEAMAKVTASRDEAMAELALKRAVQEEELKLQREKVEAEIALKAWLAEQEIAIKRGTAAADAENDAKALEHKQLCERLDHISGLLQQFEVAAKAAQTEETANG